MNAETEILDCIDRGLDSLGDSIKKVVYSNFSRMSNTNREAILERPEQFLQSIESLFGKNVHNLEASVIREFMARFEVVRSEADPDLRTAIAMVRNSLVAETKPKGSAVTPSKGRGH